MPLLGKKRFLFFLLFLVLLAVWFSAAARAEDPLFTSQEDLISFLAENRDDPDAEFTVYCSQELFEALRADDFAGYWNMLVRAGIETCDMRYNDTVYRFVFSSIVPTDIPFADCATEVEVAAAIARFTEARASEFNLICPIELKDQLFENYRISAYLARGGVLDDFDSSYYHSGRISISGLQYTDSPYAFAEDELQFCSAIERFEAQKLDAFTILFPQELFDRFVNDSREQAILRYSSRLDSYRYSYNTSLLRVTFTEVTYTDSPRILCEREEDIVLTISQMGAAGIDAFSLVVLDGDLYASLCADDFARLRFLEAEGGMWSRQMFYYDDRFRYEDALIDSDAPALSSPFDALAYVKSQVESGSRSIPLFCSEDLCSLLLEEPANGLRKIQDLTESCGIAHFYYNYREAAHLITLNELQLYPGYAIALAERSGDFSSLSPRELELRDASLKLAAALKRSDPRETALQIHDWICEHVVYTVDDAMEEDDNAIGAILNGEANCDGYSDAFYLLGTLAGLNVRYQYGDTYCRDERINPEESKHLWNLIEFDGSWRIVDVTWDDRDNEDFPCSYIWFDIGIDRAFRTHFWNTDMYGELLGSTDLSTRPVAEFIIYSLQEIDSVGKTARSDGLHSFHIFLENDSLLTQINTLTDRLVNYVKGTMHYSWNEQMQVLTIFNTAFS